MTITEQQIHDILQKHVVYEYSILTGVGFWRGADRAAQEIRATCAMAAMPAPETDRVVITTWVDQTSGDIFQSTDGIVRQVMRTKASQTRQALIALGWTPPEETKP